LSFHMLLFY